MSKYIVDTDDFEHMFKVDSIGVFGIGKSVTDNTEEHSWSRIKSLVDFEELNSDYINENFGDLQDTAYRKGRESVFHELEISGSQKGESADDAYQRGLEDGKKATFGLVADAFNADYQKGFEDGKAVHDKGCEGCEHEGKNKMTNPCILCCNSYKNRWEAKSDKIEVGDEVTHKSDSVVWKAVCIQIDGDGRHMNLMGHTGAVGYYPVEDFKKTGRHFDIASILEDMHK